MSDRSEQIDAILSAAVELTTRHDRADYIQQACAGDDELQRQVEELVDAYLSAGDFLESPAPGLPPTVDFGVEESAGTSIGRYKLLQQIGEGGFAVVFMAEQEHPVRRRVAVKIIKPGMDSRQVIARFEAERQALAMMDHSNIAKVLDAGTTESGRPYFVMELVKGTPITDFCDEHCLSIDERLALFAQVCDAVQHAHQKGVIHRDIKPGNVLVRKEDEKPVVKVIDFGIAKATETRLTDKTLFTDFRQLIGTPAYMSPEQADGSLDIDTRSDVYSLGVLLYELLSGSPPFDPRELKSRAIAEMQRIIREVDPPAPSTRLSTLDADTRVLKAKARGIEPGRLTQRLRGELDWIALRALEKDRNRRYGSAAALADDLERYLTSQPVEARPATPGYRFRKFAARNKGLLTAIGAVALVLIGATTVSTWQAIRAARAEQQALADSRRAEAISDFLVESFRSSDPDQDGRTVTIAEVLERTARDLEGKYLDEPIVKATLLHTLGMTLSSLGMPEKAVPLLEEALTLRTSALGEQDAETRATMAALARDYSRSKRHNDAVELGEESLQLQKLTFGGDSIESAEGMRLLSSIYRQCHRAKESVPLSAAALKIYQTRLGPKNELTLDMMFEQLCAIGQATGDGNVVSVPYSFGDILALAAPQLGEDHTLCLAIRDSMGYAAMHRGQYDFASEVFTELLRRWLDKLGPDGLQTRRTVDLLTRVATKHVDPRKGIRDLATAAEAAPSDPNIDAAMKQVNARLASLEEMADQYVKRITEAKDEPWTNSPRKILCRDLAQMPDVFQLAADRLPDETAIWIGRGQDHVWRDQLAAAEVDYARVIHQRPIQDEHYEYGCLLLLRGDDQAYQKFCQQQLERSGEPRDEYAAYVATRLYSLGPANCVSKKQLVEWAEFAARGRQRYQLQALALAYVRAGMLDDAVRTFKEGITNGAARYDTAENWFGLTIAYHHLGQIAKARDSLERARMAFNDAVPPRTGERAYVDVPSWWLLMRLYSNEAKGLFSHTDRLKSAE